MELGSILMLTGLIGFVGIVSVAVVGRYLGLFDLFAVMGTVLSAFFDVLGSILDWSPTWFKKILFLFVGIFFVGLIVNWIAGADKVCSEGVMYESDTLMVTFIAKLLAGTDEVRPGMSGEIETEQAAYLSNGTVLPDLEQPGLLSDTIVPIINELASLDLNTELWGTFLTTGDKVESLPEYTGSNYDVVLFLPSYTVPNEEGNLSERVSVNGTFGFDVMVRGDFYIYRETIVSAWLSGRDEGRCYLDVFPAPAAGRFWADQIGVYNIKINDDRISGREVTIVELNPSSTKIFNGGWELNECPQSGFSGEAKVTTAPASEVALSGWELQTGWVRGEYFKISDLGLDQETLVQTGISRREQYILDGLEDGVLRQYMDDSEYASFTCSENDNVRLLIFGVDLFAIKTMAFIMVLSGMFFVFRQLNIL